MRHWALRFETNSRSTITNKAGIPAYRLEVTVEPKKPVDGKTPLQLVWRVRPPQGKEIGSVTQHADHVKVGEVDREWGTHASAAAWAAARGIIKLLPDPATKR